MRRQIEHEIYIKVADFLRSEYPNVIYRFDLAADLKLTIGQAKKHRHLQYYRGYPDLFIAGPVIRMGVPSYNGMYLEIKTEGTRIFRKDGKLVADEHIREQFDMLEDLRTRGYYAEFAIGLDDVKHQINKYFAKE